MPSQRQRETLCRSAAGAARQRRATVALFLLGSLGVSLLGCGSRTMVGGASDEGPVDDFGGVAGAGGASAAGSGGQAQTPEPAVPSPVNVGGVLPACEPGFERANAGGRDCTYTFGSACYEDEGIACACACRGLAVSNCIIDGFLDLDAPQRVRCTAR